ncbi:MAG: PSD1 and planctomycete cytochrome C domain-containing protein, partial [Bryobacterales bacterium]|nr:PSD1 and planctomycete cytochrome C domain-containing protein [Bryobacterales bacterium]
MPTPFALFATMLTLVALPKAQAEVDFTRDIRPLLSEMCFACHGPDEDARAGGLRLDEFSSATHERAGKRAITPGDPTASELIARTKTDDPIRRMPLGGEALDEAQIKLLEQWISEGAEYKRHWAYEKPERPELPVVSNEAWPRNPIDRFILSKLEAEGLQPSAEAEPAVLMRRLYLDLTGIPPTPEQIDDYLANPTDEAYRAKVEELLASPQYGEQWARHWLDLARYSDSNGYQHDDLREIWPYRDWIIQAFNDDMPFDQFTIEQLAGDLLEEPTLDQLIATGFNRNSPMNGSGGSKIDEVRNSILVDRVNTTATVWLGSTLGCAQCHTHKYDPFTIEEYYRFYAYFERGIDETVLRGGGNTRKYYVGAQVELPISPAQRARYEGVKAQHEFVKMVINDTEFRVAADLPAWIDEQAGNKELPPKVVSALAKPPDERTELDNNFIRDEFLKTRPEVAEPRKELAELARRLEDLAPTTTLIMADKAGPVTSYLLERGQIGAHGKEVEPGTPAAMHELDSDMPLDRLGLAKWITSPENPLTARVTVNRLWAEAFGRGIVASADDFGRQGDAPTHPELLDWLAVEFAEGGWSVKSVVRLMVTSATYRQASRVSDTLRERDPENTLLARGPRYRLPAEAIRDSLLAASGLLSL